MTIFSDISGVWQNRFTNLKMYSLIPELATVWK